MISISKVKDEMASMERTAEQEWRAHRKIDQKPTRKYLLLKKVLAYLQTSPREDFVKEMLAETSKKIQVYSQRAADEARQECSNMEDMETLIAEKKRYYDIAGLKDKKKVLEFILE